MNEKNFKTVFHNIFGEGIIVETRWNGAESRVKFRSGLCLWLPTKWLKELKVEEKELDRVSSRRLIEAFRLGVVPHQDIEAFTFGRNYEIELFHKALDNLKKGTGGVFLIEGEYGSGKSHLAEYLRHLSLKNGLATAYCELHVHETPPYRPKKIYHELVYSLRYIKDGCEYGFRDLLREASKIELTDHCFLTPVLRKIRDIEENGSYSEVFWQWIEGESTKEYATDRDSPFRVRGGQQIPALYDFSTAADFYNYILSGLSYIARQLGLGGLVLIIDEFEEINHIWEYHYQERGRAFLEGLVRIALNDQELKKVDRYLLHNQVRPTPYSYKENYILLMLATTPGEDDWITRFIKNKIFLRRFSRAELEQIFDNLLRIYKTAFSGFNIDTKTQNNILNAALKKFSNELRMFIKYSVEAFDSIRIKSQRY
ncbi:MAG: ATP-binding protein [candidate division WOR-3 bacterium]|nr:ATP-binding protein [candidate division WOR-3 bacterium]